MTTSPFDDYRPPEEGRRRGHRPSVSASVSGVARDLTKGARRGWLGREGGGRREAPAVPDAEFSSYYGQPVIKPVPWKHEIPAYLFVGGVAAGSGLLATGAAATGLDVLRRRTRFTAMVGVGASGAFLVADLGRPERFLNMMRTVKLTSPMSVGTWILSAYAAFSGVTTAVEVSRMAPSGLQRALAPLARLLETAHAPAAVGQALFGPPLAAYTSVLLSGTVTPLWFESRRDLPFLFAGSAALATGGVHMVLNPVTQAGPARRFALMGVAADLVAMHRLEGRAEDLGIDEPMREGEAGTKLRLAKALTIAGGLGTLLAGRSRFVAAASGAALTAASALTRFGIVEAGIETAQDPKYTVGPQKRRLDDRRREGRVDDSIVTVR